MIPTRYAPDFESDTDLLDEVVDEVRSEVLPRLKDVKKITVHAVKGIRHLGKYVHGTKKNPVILVSLRACERASEKYDADEYTTVLTTVLHELAHAVQEIRGLPFDEKQAEDFAYEYWDSGSVRFI